MVSFFPFPQKNFAATQWRILCTVFSTRNRTLNLRSRSEQVLEFKSYLSSLKCNILLGFCACFSNIAQHREAAPGHANSKSLHTLQISGGQHTYEASDKIQYEVKNIKMVMIYIFFKNHSFFPLTKLEENSHHQIW